MKASSRAATNRTRRTDFGGELRFEELRQLTALNAGRKSIKWNDLEPFEFRKVPDQLGPLLSPDSHLTTDYLADDP